MLLSNAITNYDNDIVSIDFTLNDDNTIKLEKFSEADEEIYEEELLYIIDTITELVEYELKPIKTIYNYIQDVKENQIDYFKEYVEETFCANF